MGPNTKQYMIKTIRTYTDQPLEAGKTYKTRLQTGEMFTVTKDQFKRDKNGVIFSSSDTVYGIWEKHPHLGICPLAVSRLIPDRIKDEMTDEVCDKCGEPIWHKNNH